MAMQDHIWPTYWIGNQDDLLVVELVSEDGRDKVNKTNQDDLLLVNPFPQDDEIERGWTS